MSRISPIRSLVNRMAKTRFVTFIGVAAVILLGILILTCSSH